MGEHAQQLSERIEQLQQQLQRYADKERWAGAVDEALELAIQQQLPLRRTLALVLPLLTQATGAGAARVRTYDEDLEMSEFWHASTASRDPWVVERLDRLDRLAARGEGFTDACSSMAIVACPLDVAGDSFGSVALIFAGDPSDDAQERSRALLQVCAEQLDGHLATIAQARRKHQVTLRLSEALKAPLLESGIDRAIDVLWRSVGFEHLVLAYRHQGASASSGVSYKVVQAGQLVADSNSDIGKGGVLSELLREHAHELMQGRSGPVLDQLGIARHREEVLISGIRNRRVVGRLMVAQRAGNFSASDRDLLQCFADYLRQRIVDFNREWKYLSLCFPPTVVQQLMGEEDYVERHLRPQLREVAVMFCDLSGFTRICEQQLRDPARIADLINRWSERVVDLIWRSGGVLDKMVGDCAIGLWGPPFFRMSPAEAAGRAARCALDIRRYTPQLGQNGETALAVATGLNYCPLFVGRFGPNDDYTGFSSGMNNTARLQALAVADEVLCTDDFVQAHGDASAFGDLQAAQVKNVADPLRYRALRPQVMD